MELVNGEYGGSRIIDRRLEGLERDIDDNAKGKCRVLLHGALRSEHSGCSQRSVCDCGCAAVEIEKRFINRDEVPHLRDDLDDAVQSLRLAASAFTSIPRTISDVPS